MWSANPKRAAKKKREKADSRRRIRYSNSMRRHKTVAEEHALTVMQELLKDEIILSQFLFKFYIVDFVLPRRLLVVEIDGPNHNRKRKYDACRDAFLGDCGLKILHVTNKSVSEEPALLVEKVKEFKNQPNWDIRFRAAIKIACSASSPTAKKRKPKGIGGLPKFDFEASSARV